MRKGRYNFYDQRAVGFELPIAMWLSVQNNHMAMDLMAPDRVFKALSDPTRRGLFERLCQDGELTVQQLTDGAAVSQPAVSKHLAVLLAAGLVGMRPEGRQSHYAARPEALVPLSNWVRLHASFWAGRLDPLTELLSKIG